jgi:hypothetical protein
MMVASGATAVVTYGVGTSGEILGGSLLFGLIVVVVLVAVLSFRGSRRPSPPRALFLFGTCLVSMVIGVASLGVSVHAVAQLVGPSTSMTDTLPPDAFTESGGTGGLVTIPDQSDSGLNGATGSFTFVAVDSTNHDISAAVEAALFALAAMACYGLAWRSAGRLGGSVSDDDLSRIRSGYGYLVAGLAALAVLILAPVSANNVFRAIAPGVAGAEGHAVGLRNLVTSTTLLGVSLIILRVHLRYAVGPIPGPAAEPPPSPAGV